MKKAINVLNPQVSEFIWSDISIDSEYNIVLHCIYDPVNHFEDELNFLQDSKYGTDTLIILWHAVEEGPWFDTVWINKLNSIVKKAPYKLIYLTGCSHKLSLVEVLQINFEVKFFPIFDIRSKDIWQRSLSLCTNKNKKFIFLNAKDGQHKRYVLGKLIQNNLLDNGYVSYQCYEGLVDINLSIGIRHFSDYIQTMEYCKPYIPIKIDNSNISTTLPRELFESSYVNVVSETRFANIMKYKTSFVTEKTFNAIANNQIFIIVGHAGSLDLLKSLGYKTFDCIIDETYDTVYNNADRLQIVSNTIIDYLKKPINEIREDYIKVKDIIEYNRNVLYKQSLESRLQSVINDLDSK